VRGPADAGSLPLAFLLVLAGLSMSALLVPTVAGQLTATRSGSDRIRALHAAQAGLDTAMGQIRAATESTGAGDLTRLPTGVLTGSAAPDGTERFHVTIQYRDLDGNTLGTPPADQPGSAVLVSTGSAAAAGSLTIGAAGTRTLQAVYTFRTSNENIPGGQIHVRSSGGVDLCVDAGAQHPPAGTQVTMRSCRGMPKQQLFAYNPDLTLTLVSSKTAGNPSGMCLDAGSPHTVGARVGLQPCSGPGASPAQQWSANDVANLMGTADGASLDGFCFNVLQPDTPGSPVVLGNGANCYGNYDNVQTFQPDPSVGAGAAGAATGQLVNFKQFGRCLDVTNGDTAHSYLIAWPCKQAPNPSYVTWNQRWRIPAIDAASRSGTGRIYVNHNGVDHCLRSPGATRGLYPTVAPCPAGALPADMTWTVYGATGTYATSHQIVDGTQPPGGPALCLAPADPNAASPELYVNAYYTGPPISRIVMRACDGSAWQKWNAPADLTRPLPLTEFVER
jgi:hypothetical protein